MSSTPPTDRRARAMAVLAERARRATAIRRRVIAATLATFVLAWGAVVFDGSMGATTSTASTQLASTTTATTTAAAATATATPTPTTSSPGTSSSGTASTLTTNQS